MNIAEILKDKPEGTPLYSNVYGSCKLWAVEDEETIRTSSEIHINGRPCSGTEIYQSNGKVCDEGRVQLFPSDVMREWPKFAWERGDVLRDGNTFVMFDGWTKDDYSEFKAAFEIYANGNFDCGEVFFTESFEKAEYDLSKKFVKKIENFYGGTLDMETLTISKKEKFKDGDILAIDESKFFAKCIFIFSSMKDKDGYSYYAFYNERSKILSMNNVAILDVSPRLATEDEKQHLFSILNRGGLQWDGTLKKVVRISKECKLNAFDRVLVRDMDSDNWNAALFSHKEGKLFYIANGSYKLQCIPYNENTRHLLGTNEYYKSDERG